MSGSGVLKQCAVCGSDLSGKPRVKDAQGRYACVGDCAEKVMKQARNAAKAAAEAPKPEIVVRTNAVLSPTVGVTSRPEAAAARFKAGREDDGSVLNALIDSSPMLNAQKCDGCKLPIPNGTLVCTHCGYNTQTGKKLKTQVAKAPKEKKEAPIGKLRPSSRFAGGSDGMSYAALLGIYTAVFAVVLGIATTTPSGLLLSVAVLGIASVAVWIGGLVVAFREGQMLWGILALIPGVNFICWIYYLVLCPSRRLKALAGATVIGSLLLGVLVGSGSIALPPVEGAG